MTSQWKFGLVYLLLLFEYIMKYELVAHWLALYSKSLLSLYNHNSLVLTLVDVEHRYLIIFQEEPQQYGQR